MPIRSSFPEEMREIDIKAEAGRKAVLTAIDAEIARFDESFRQRSGDSIPRFQKELFRAYLWEQFILWRGASG